LVDPQGDTAFYVRNRTGHRCFAHVEEARKTTRYSKSDYGKLATIPAIEDAGGEVRIEILFTMALPRSRRSGDAPSVLLPGRCLKPMSRDADFRQDLPNRERQRPGPLLGLYRASQDRFDRDGGTFAHGVEIGMLWQKIQTEPLPLEAMAHVESMEMVIRLAEARAVSVRADDSDGDWLYVTYP
jgi:hypothetical protein